ncbi:hypothetical protein MRX96_011232 [Rhipicephalus microplus]
MERGEPGKIVITSCRGDEESRKERGSGSDVLCGNNVVGATAGTTTSLRRPQPDRHQWSRRLWRSVVPASGGGSSSVRDTYRSRCECVPTVSPPTTDYYFYTRPARKGRRRRAVDGFAGVPVNRRPVGVVIIPPGCASPLEAHRGG